jgi:mannose-1-phosphate guanylyltransferase
MPRQSITPVILCGGSGSRLWPRSRPQTPKPFLPLVGNSTLFQETLQRTRNAAFSNPIVVAGAAHVDLVEAQSEGFDLAETIVEPEPRQTAAAVALAALRLGDDAIMLVCPSDHHIDSGSAFVEAATTAASLAADNWLVCLCAVASSPDVHFGYVRRGEALDGGGFRVAEFVEKPDKAKAAQFLATGLYAWNAGIFAFRAGDYLRELERFRPAVADAVRRSVSMGRSAGRHFYPDPAAFADVEPESLDYAVMENTDRAALVMGDMGWSDVGNWQALYAMRDKDAAGNAVRGPASLVDCRNVLVDSDGPNVHVIGMEGVVVVVDGGDILVANAARAAEVGKLKKTD